MPEGGGRQGTWFEWKEATVQKARVELGIGESCISVLGHLLRTGRHTRHAYKPWLSLALTHTAQFVLEPW